MKTYIFFRKEGFYPVEYKNNEEAIEGAKLNKGTLKVKTASGKTIWKL